MNDEAPITVAPTIQEQLEFVAYQINNRYGVHPEATLIREAIEYITLLEANQKPATTKAKA